MAGKASDPHVRLYRYELQSAAYRSLSPAARALLVEFRALWNHENRVHMSIRQAQERVNAGRKVAERALRELIDRGFIRMIEKGSFHCKIKEASVFALTNLPLDDQRGSVAPKDYMRWVPSQNTVYVADTDGVREGHRDQRHGVREGHRRCT